MRTPIVLALLAIIAPAASYAQGSVAGASGLKPGALPTVYVRDDRGAETTGKLVQLTTDAVVLLVDGKERRFDLPRVTRVSRRGDSLKNGAVIGAAVGALMGVLAATISDCPNNGGYSGCGIGTRIGIAAFSTGIYAGMGTGIDALIQGRTLLYQAPPPSASRRSATSIAFRLAW